MQLFRAKQLYFSGEYGEMVFTIILVQDEGAYIQSACPNVYKKMEPVISESGTSITYYFRYHLWNQIEVALLISRHRPFFANVLNRSSRVSNSDCSVFLRDKPRGFAY